LDFSDELQLCRGIEGEHVDGHHHRHTELLRVLNLKDDKKSSVAYPGCLSRILIFIHPGSRIQKQQQKRGGEIN
jgi:hypothetical protein